MKAYTGKCIIFLLACQFFLVSSLLPAAQAELVSTRALLESSAADTTRQRLQAAIARDDVRAELIRLGVDPAAAENRLAQLSEDELQQLQGRLDELPAGGSVLAVIGVVFVVLIILELVGVTNIFTKV